MDFDQLTLTQAVADLRAGKVTSTALTTEALARAKANADLNAFVTLDEAGALKAAAAFDANDNKDKPLGGVPIVIKDNIEVTGLPCSAGTPALKHYVPRADAPVVAKLRAAGAVIIGKTSMHELAFGISGYNTAFKTGAEFGVRNAYDRTLIAGGSSSGTGVAIGARIVAGGLGTDTGGSVRVPAALNGCASLRPTVGRYPQAGIAPISHTRDTAGPMAATAADVELLDRVIAGGEAVQAADLKQMRIGIVRSMLTNLDADTNAAFQAAVAKMKAQGVTMVEIEMPQLAEFNGQVSFPVALYEAYDDLVAYLDHTGTGLSIEAMARDISSADVKGTYDGLVIPRKLPAPDGTLVDAKPIYDAAINSARPALQVLYSRTFADNRLDAIAFPTTPRVAIASNPDSSSLENFGLFIQNTDPGSNAGIPGIQIPIALGAVSKLPIGLELDGPAGSDRRLLALGMALEKVFGRLPAPPRS
ncbi:Asp-tRNA(Asn)/Glu-tRNA(Gln) amidotransferase A subunit family amidase [Bradyrhizobium sp. GM2.2]|jgi:indoleacetamide hydrolase|uniref:indoleacetamide hydrolase n=1 Tax=unclassified Bradyrhizobium TaxID=2631580 RepID=UPI0003707E35|nr:MULTISPECIES: indoleacetamide hydrolase [unclassified Bradyrhizobium]MCK1291445.1 indoleacetamide hydrolase [Bradyrhizobium sp. 30]MCK1308405.1 indoleacetamide hydrolase [Bradyrhizobium sp. 45]MCK1313224.1 indoleacetamide hydrolase [Bradyrhizobium sp. 23]MCK1327825.1 indoleacetamide hydrolase [Bradyrhizobium sp. CW9]MCK1347864.1 indoleacetamide hydrolase [Bradyrhizobium sp. CW11]